MATINPAKIIKPTAEARHAPGRRARRLCRCWRFVEGPVEFVDTRDNKRGKAKFSCRPAGVVLGGVPFGRPYQQPFAVR